MHGHDFSDFLAAAHTRSGAQHLLFVFAVAELRQASTSGQQRRFREGRGAITFS